MMDKCGRIKYRGENLAETGCCIGVWVRVVLKEEYKRYQGNTARYRSARDCRSLSVTFFGRCTAAAASMPFNRPFAMSCHILLFELNVHSSYGPVVLRGRRLIGFFFFHFRLQPRDSFLLGV
jgi:hypothetical protein